MECNYSKNYFNIGIKYDIMLLEIIIQQKKNVEIIKKKSMQIIYYVHIEIRLEFKYKVGVE